MAERLLGACFTWFRQLLKLRFWATHWGTLGAVYSFLSFGRWKAFIRDNWSLSLVLCLWQHNRNNVKVGAFLKERVSLRLTLAFHANIFEPLDKLKIFLITTLLLSVLAWNYSRLSSTKTISSMRNNCQVSFSSHPLGLSLIHIWRCRRRG